jgi:hypothetical protein
VTADAVPALLRIRSVAALVMARAGYDTLQIAESLGATTTVARPKDVGPELLVAAGQYLADVGFTYWGIPEAMAQLRSDVVPQSQPEAEAVPAPAPAAWDHGVLFDVGVP